MLIACREKRIKCNQAPCSSSAGIKLFDCSISGRTANMRRFLLALRTVRPSRSVASRIASSNYAPNPAAKSASRYTSARNVSQRNSVPRFQFELCSKNSSKRRSFAPKGAKPAVLSRVCAATQINFSYTNGLKARIRCLAVSVINSRNAASQRPEQSSIINTSSSQYPMNYRYNGFRAFPPLLIISFSAATPACTSRSCAAPRGYNGYRTRTWKFVPPAVGVNCAKKASVPCLRTVSSNASSYPKTPDKYNGSSSTTDVYPRACRTSNIQFSCALSSTGASKSSSHNDLFIQNASRVVTSASNNLYTLALLCYAIFSIADSGYNSTVLSSMSCCIPSDISSSSSVSSYRDRNSALNFSIIYQGSSNYGSSVYISSYGFT